MIKRFLFWVFFFTILGGIFIHFHTKFPPFLSWFGRLPGDMVIMRKKSYVDLPVVSSSIISGIIVLLTSIFTRKR